MSNVSIIRQARNIWALAIASSAAMFVTCQPRAATADFLPVYGGPITSGYWVEYPPQGGHTHVNNAGSAVGTIIKDYISAEVLVPNSRAVRWNRAGGAELGILETDTRGWTESTPSAINSAGTAVGWANKYYIESNSMQPHAVRWDASGTAATELGHLAGAPLKGTQSQALAINDAGMVVGWADKPYDDDAGYPGRRAVRWDAFGMATELAHFGINADGYTRSEAISINTSGTAVGWASKFDSTGDYIGDYPLRWEASGTASELALPFPVASYEFTRISYAAISDVGTAVANVSVYYPGYSWDERVVRWNASGTATVLPIVPPPHVPHTALLSGSHASGINAAGASVGHIRYLTSEVVCDETACYDNGSTFGTRAVRWNASGTEVAALESLGTDASGFTFDDAFAINSVGTVVGSAREYDASGNAIGDRAVYWEVDGTVVDLNSLIDPASGWFLAVASDISDTGWISGTGSFEGVASHFLMRVPATAVTLSGDFNDDGTVDAADYVVWRKTDGTHAEYDSWRANFGEPAGSGSVAGANATVPEPTTLVMVVAAVGIRLRRCHVASRVSSTRNA
jgi:hypothetical protein